MSLPIQDEPESTIGRKPAELAGHPGPPRHEPARSGAGGRHEEGDERERAGKGAREEPPSLRGPGR
ncbi:hypothetical protein AMOR_19330 [Anaeromyxobacter oryzae]|uniref:Uncharacterized protein n=1 Tax=Anaeromyxobacter oryzae TaxID=2918170 RepID=A0ABM7WU72_9BACT|nr:hypothetical protein AMOR_19330 [Anaeromyxobacter oryzae]